MPQDMRMRSRRRALGWAVPVGAAIAALAIPASALGIRIAIPVQANVDLLTEADFQVDGARVNDEIGRWVGPTNLDSAGSQGLIVSAGEPAGGLAAPRSLAEVVFDRPPPLLDLANLGGAGLRIQTSGGGYSGYAAPVGDVNGDGNEDVAVSSIRGDAYVVFGGGPTTDVNLDALGTRGIQIVVPHGFSGLASQARVVGVGDQNGDGRGDLLVGSSLARRAWVVFGTAGPAAIDVLALGGGGYAIDGTDGVGHPGREVSSAGDVNGDGREDLLIGTFAVDGAVVNDGAFVVHGKANTTPVQLEALGSAGYRVTNSGSGYAGRAVAPAGDVNGDGVADQLIWIEGDYDADRDEVAVVFGSPSSAEVDLDALGTRGFRILGPNEPGGSNFGSALAGGRDLNRDGRDDILIGAPYTSVGGRGRGGAAYVVYGKASTRNLNVTRSRKVFRIDGPAAQAEAGSSVAFGAGTGQSIDILVGAPGNGANGRNDSGSVFGVRPSALPGTPRLSNVAVNKTKLTGSGSGSGGGGATLISYRTRGRLTMSVRIIREIPGRRTKTGRCVRGRAARKADACTRLVPVTTVRKLQRKRGSGSIAIRRRIRGKTLAPGRYLLQITGRSPKGRTWGPAEQRLTVTKG